MQIVQCDEQHRQEWNAFVRRSPRASLYHRYEWRNVNRQSFGYRSAYLAALVDGRIAGIFPFVQVKSSLFGNIACSLPFVNFGGPCGDSPEIEHALVEAAKPIVRDWRSDYLEIRTPHQVDGLPTSEHKVSMTLDLVSDPEELWKNFKTGHRQDIRAAYKKGATVKVGRADLIDDFYAVLSESWRDLGTPIYSRRFLDNIARAFPDEIRVTVVYSDGEPAATAFDLMSGEHAEGLWLGSRGKFRKQNVGYVLYWELIKDACERGVKTFHLGRSTVQSGGETFKKKWNAYQTQLFWQYVMRNDAPLPQLNVSNPKYRFAIRAWQQLPVSVAQMIGPFIARSIP
ncbi:MAG TPA: FemAB family XrtA/PEP-CTERM system-associated protein [Vicinamibacterales bacterium]|nr:FemAB family XrtA/PEP-CTERM system-associated protein [Vicinamibacterales bacterium]